MQQILRASVLALLMTATSIMAGLNISYACSVAPRGMYLDHKSAIDQAEWIVIAKMNRVETRPTPEDRRRKESRFAVLEVVEYLKGNGPSEIAIKNYGTSRARDDSRDPGEANYYSHAASSFWAFGGRSYNSPDCKIHPSFLYSDNLYVVFGPDQHNVGYENVVVDDRWVNFIRQYVAEAEATSLPFPVEARDYFGSAMAVVQLSAVWSENGPILSTGILKGPNLPYFEMLYVSPAASMARKLDPDCRGGRDSFPGPRQEKVAMLVVFEFLPEEEVQKIDSIDCAGRDRNGQATARGKGKFSTNGHRTFPVVGDKVDFGEVTPIMTVEGEKIVAMSLNEVREMAAVTDARN